MGAKLSAWIGGFALFLGIAFFVKYSFEHNLIPAELRVAIGFVVGAGLVAGGLLLKRKENAVTAQTLCATGILVLYAVTFACRAYYHFAFFGFIPTLLLMTLITAVAFLLSVRLNAIVVSVLGIAGGFLTPILLSTNQDNPLGLFGYIALLDIGLLALKEKPRSVDRLLHVHAVVEHVENDLNVTHRLVVRAHDAEAHVAAAIAHRERRNDRMHRALARTEDVRMTLLQREASAAIVEHDARFLCANSEAEAGIQ